MDERARRGVDRLTIQEAARALGVSEGAIRKRVTRGTLQHEKEDDGRVYVYVDTGGRRGVDAGQDEGVDPNNNALISQLRDEVAYLRDENRRKDEIIMQQAMTMRQLTAAEPQEAREAPETVEEEPDRAEPLSATGEAQEGTERPQHRGGWLAPVDKLPWWHYVLGLVAMVVGTVAANFVYYLPGPDYVLTIVMLGLPSSMGIWVGLRQRYVRVWRRVVPFGALLGVAFVSTLVFCAPDRLIHDGRLVVASMATYVTAPCLVYVSGVLIGNAVQRRFTGRRSGTIPASPLSRTTSAATGSGTGWTPRQQAILGFVGTVIAALLGLFASVIGAIVASGG